MKRIKACFYSGLFAILPVVLTIYIFNWVFDIFLNLLQDSFITVTIKQIVLSLGKEKDIDFYMNVFINFISFITVVVGLILIGTAMRIFMFKKIGKFFDNLFTKIPLFNQIYSTVNQIISLVTSDREKAYQKVVMIEYPRKGLYSIGFLTAEGNHIVEEHTGEEMYNVFIPTSPNPTSGVFLVVKKKDVTILDIKVDDAVKLVISGGVILPPKKES